MCNTLPCTLRSLQYVLVLLHVEAVQVLLVVGRGRQELDPLFYRCLAKICFDKSCAGTANPVVVWTYTTRQAGLPSRRLISHRPDYRDREETAKRG